MAAMTMLPPMMSVATQAIALFRRARLRSRRALPSHAADGGVEKPASGSSAMRSRIAADMGDGAAASGTGSGVPAAGAGNCGSAPPARQTTSGCAQAGS